MRADYKEKIDRAIVHLENALADLRKLQSRKTLARMNSWVEENPADPAQRELRSADGYVQDLERMLRPPEPTCKAPPAEPDLAGDQHVQIRRLKNLLPAAPKAKALRTQAIDLFDGGGS